MKSLSGKAWSRGLTTGVVLTETGLAAACALVFILGTQLKEERKRNDDMLRRFTLPHSGMYLPRFETKTLTGDTVAIGVSSDSGRQVLFVFTTTCPYCVASLPAWRAIADSVRLGALPARLFGITLDSTAATSLYVQVHELSYPVVMFPHRRFRQFYRATQVPQTIVLDDQGLVLYARTGQMDAGLGLDSVLAALRWRRPPAVGADRASGRTFTRRTQ